MLISVQLRAARALLGWTAKDLAERGGLHLSTVQRMEQCQGPVRGNVMSLNAVLDALQHNGIEFVSGNDKVGVLLGNGNAPK